MLFPWTFVVLVACSVAVLGETPTVSVRTPLPLNPPESAIINHHIGARAATPQTNAKRLAAGLPPLPPTKRWLVGDNPKPLHPRVSSIAVPCSPSVVQVNNGTTVLGFLSRRLNEFGEYAQVVKDKDQAIQICLSRPNALNGNADATAVNSFVRSLPFFGAFVGAYSSSSSITTTSASYLFLGQNTQTGAGAVPVVPPSSSDTAFGVATDISEPFESNIWRVNGATNELQLWWVNPDQSTVQVSILFVEPDGLIVGTGNPTLFSQTYDRNVTPLTLYFVPNY